jgi:hypothetical protein
MGHDTRSQTVRRYFWPWQTTEKVKALYDTFENLAIRITPPTQKLVFFNRHYAMHRDAPLESHCGAIFGTFGARQTM